MITRLYPPHEGVLHCFCLRIVIPVLLGYILAVSPRLLVWKRRSGLLPPQLHNYSIQNWTRTTKLFLNITAVLFIRLFLSLTFSCPGIFLLSFRLMLQDLPENHVAPECLHSHIREQLRIQRVTQAYKFGRTCSVLYHEFRIWIKFLSFLEKKRSHAIRTWGFVRMHCKEGSGHDAFCSERPKRWKCFTCDDMHNDN